MPDSVRMRMTTLSVWMNVVVPEGTDIKALCVELKPADVKVVDAQGQVVGMLTNYGTADVFDDNEPEICDECGATIPDYAESIINPYHDETCSCHPDNTV